MKDGYEAQGGQNEMTIIARQLGSEGYPALGCISVLSAYIEEGIMTSMESILTIHRFIRRKIKYFPVLYYMLLALYCTFLLFSGGKDIPSLAIAPFIYAMIIPVLLFFSLPLLYLLAYSLYGDRLFVKRITGALIASLLVASFVLGFVNLLRNSLPDLVLHLSNISSLYQFGEGDAMFIFISLLEVTITSLYTARTGSSKIESIDNWFRQIATNGIIGMLWMVGALLFALPIAGIADLFYSDQSKVAFLFLLGFYLVFVYLRWRILRNEKSFP